MSNHAPDLTAEQRNKLTPQELAELSLGGSLSPQRQQMIQPPQPSGDGPLSPLDAAKLAQKPPSYSPQQLAEAGLNGHRIGADGRLIDPRGAGLGA